MNRLALYDLLWIVWCVGLCGCGTNLPKDAQHTIQVGTAMDNLTPLRLSEMVDSVEYIPLETTEKSLVGSQPQVRVTADRIFVDYRATDKALLSFDRSTGRFVGSIGYTGTDPFGYSNLYFYPANYLPYWVDEEARVIYFHGRTNDEYQLYDFDGHYIGHTTFREDSVAKDSRYTRLLFDGNKVWAYNLAHRVDESKLVVLDKTTGRMLAKYTDGLLLSDKMVGNDGWGCWYSSGRGMDFGCSRVEFLQNNAGDTCYVCAYDAPVVYKVGSEGICMKEFYSDTIYSVDYPDHRTPRYTFDMGVWGCPAEERMVVGTSKNRLSVDFVLENEHIIYFHCFKDLLLLSAEGRSLRDAYCGFYDKRSHATRMMHGVAIEDDLCGVASLSPVGMTEDGALYGLLTPSDILSIESDSPSPELQRLQHLLKEDDNPVVVIAK